MSDARPGRRQSAGRMIRIRFRGGMPRSASETPPEFTGESMTPRPPEATIPLRSDHNFLGSAEKSCVRRGMQQAKRSRRMARPYLMCGRNDNRLRLSALNRKRRAEYPRCNVRRSLRRGTGRTGRGRRRHRHRGTRRHGRTATRRRIRRDTLVAATTACTRENRADQHRDHQLSHEHNLNPPPEQRGGRRVPPTPNAQPPARTPTRRSRADGPLINQGEAVPSRVEKPSPRLRTTGAPAPGRNGFRRASLTR